MAKEPENTIETCIAAIEAGDAARALVPLIVASAKAEAFDEAIAAASDWGSIYNLDLIENPYR